MVLRSPTVVTVYSAPTPAHTDIVLACQRTFVTCTAAFFSHTPLAMQPGLSYRRSFGAHCLWLIGAKLLLGEESLKTGVRGGHAH